MPTLKVFVNELLFDTVSAFLRMILELKESNFNWDNGTSQAGL